MSPDVLQVGDHGPIFELQEPWTVEAVKTGMGEAPPRQLCRLFGRVPWRHKRRVIGRTYLPADDPFTSMLALIAEGSSSKTLMRCKRCGAVQIRSGP
jgi:hypothetical protein